jgi:THO complex subunit 2
MCSCRPHSHILFERLAPLHPVAHEQICYGLCRAIENAILPYYAYVRPEYLSRLGSRVGGDIEVKLAGPPELPKNVFQMLSRIGPYLHRNVLLLQKVCRVLRGYYEATLAHSTLVSNSQDDGEIEKGDVRQAEKEKAEAASQLEEALGACLLPSLQLLPANPAVGLAIWEVMTLLPYEVSHHSHQMHIEFEILYLLNESYVML